jgi:4-hydroxy-3-polyprenylbenzoate decarboxylase
MGRRLLMEECGVKSLDAQTLAADSTLEPFVHVHRDGDMGACIASGSFLHDGMAIVPCSSNTLGHLASGLTNSLVHRAAAVALKERRRLVIAHRETPLSRIDIGNMATMSDAGAIIAPLTPGFYLQPESVEDIIDFMAARIVDLLGVAHNLPVRWQGTHAHLGQQSQ